MYLVLVGGPVLDRRRGRGDRRDARLHGRAVAYGYRGLGELFVFMFFGLVAVVGTAYLQALRLEPLYVLAAIPIGSLITAILVVNNLRDIPTDRVAGKRTLAVTFGEGFAKGEYVALLAVGALIPVVLVVSSMAGPAVLLAELGVRPGDRSRAAGHVARPDDRPAVAATRCSRRPPGCRSSTRCCSRSGSCWAAGPG